MTYIDNDKFWEAREKGKTMTDNTEYLRRNLVAAKAMGVRAGLKCISDRLHENKNSPLWLLTIVGNELAKTNDICAELARHRDEEKGE